MEIAFVHWNCNLAILISKGFMDHLYHISVILHTWYQVQIERFRVSSMRILNAYPHAAYRYVRTISAFEQYGSNCLVAVIVGPIFDYLCFLAQCYDGDAVRI